MSVWEISRDKCVELWADINFSEKYAVWIFSIDDGVSMFLRNIGIYPYLNFGFLIFRASTILNGTSAKHGFWNIFVLWEGCFRSFIDELFS